MHLAMAPSILVKIIQGQADTDHQYAQHHGCQCIAYSRAGLVHHALPFVCVQPLSVSLL